MISKESMVLKSAKSELNNDQRIMFEQEFEKKEKKVLTTYLLWGLLALIGIHGIHRFYLGKVGLGILYLLTGGLFMIGWIVDGFINVSLVRKANETIARDIILEVKMLTKDKSKE